MTKKSASGLVCARVSSTKKRMAKVMPKRTRSIPGETGLPVKGARTEVNRNRADNADGVKPG